MRCYARLLEKQEEAEAREKQARLEKLMRHWDPTAVMRGQPENLKAAMRQAAKSFKDDLGAWETHTALKMKYDRIGNDLHSHFLAENKFK